MTARRAAFTSENIRSGFQNTGLIPPNRMIVITKIEAIQAESLTNNSSSNSSNHTTTARTPNPIPLSAFSSFQINNLPVPLRKDEIEEQELLVLATLPTNDQTAWGLKKVVSNITISAQRALTELEEKDHQIHNLKKQLADTQQKKQVNRTRIPTSGRAWIDRDEIAKFFETQMVEERETAKKRYENAMNLTGATLWFEESHLSRQISEVQGKVKKFEKYIEHLIPHQSATDNIAELLELNLVEVIAEEEPNLVGVSTEAGVHDSLSDVGEDSHGGDFGWISRAEVETLGPEVEAEISDAEVGGTPTSSFGEIMDFSICL
ncbi:hypothetical protein HOY80DRAFT_1032931 [Tuber brumale]|nr:hypothetical protein HOY80DRAFT_1032931 [Tuber brumale]